MAAPYLALTVLLYGFAALFVWAAARLWLQLGKRHNLDFPAARFRTAAITTGIALVTLGAALAWSALVAVSLI